MNEDKIKKLLKDSSNEYQIKTTSDDIINRFFDVQQEEKIVTFDFKKLITPISAILLTLIAVIVIPFDSFITPDVITTTDPTILPTTSLNPDTQEEYLEANSKQNQAAFSIFSGMNVLSNFKLNVDGINNLKMLKNKPNDDPYHDEDRNEPPLNEDGDFSEIVDVFDPTVDVITSLFDKSINVESKIYEGEYIGKFDRYLYKLEIYNYVLYTNISLSSEGHHETETIYEGELYSEGEYYKVELSIEEEMGKPEEKHKFDDQGKEPHKPENRYEFELEMVIYYSDYELHIEQESEDNEITYTYSLVDDFEVIYEENISFERDRRKNAYCEVEVIKDNKYYEFSRIVPINNGLECEYIKDHNFQNLKFGLEFVGLNRIYTNNRGEIIKK